jgi:Zn-dependent peptidase ImmA (M78 family)
VSFPRKVKVGHARYTMKYEAELASISGANGTCGEDTQTILIDPLMGRDMERDTVLHELLHAVFHLSDARAHLPKDDSGDTKDAEEKVIRPLASQLLELLRDNPKLVAYLLEA